jgi:transcriptional regulator with XRE-family HTH domain
MAAKARGPHPNRKRREEVARLRAEGLTLQGIGQHLGISHQAVAQILRRCGSTRVPVCAGCGAALTTRGGPVSHPVYCPRCLATRPGLPFPAQLRSRRLAAGFTQAELAWRVGLNVSAVRNYEYGRALPKSRTLARLIAVLGAALKGTND